ncbi:membrane protein insertase YidC [Maricaulis sp.]|jgi:YidC/Oxa1 family membrane protein insertase|uniref:membrane protein insertase YidC n=1 Tax=Maricaulis sp. TaxID=1486257 RepID=UPI0025EEE93C|nr:membrane protein insertase YidC [Maricaulis sp.]MDF1769980.1 membrane protein insertase YidC [Maricaulis sp.]
MGEDQRNLFIALGLILVILTGYQMFVMGPAEEERRAEREAALEAAGGELIDPDLPASALEPAAVTTVDRETALTGNDRITIDAPAVLGSLSLTGARLDDIRLRRHSETIDDDTPVALLNPIGGDHVFYARDGWVSGTPGFTDLPGGSTEWTLASGSTLTPETPVTLTYDSPSGLTFERVISVDEDYLFTLSDTVTNNSGEEVELSRYGLVRHEGRPEDETRNMAIFEGALAVIEGAMVRRSFGKLEDGEQIEESGTGGWVSITQRYWMAAAVPDQDRPFTARFRTIERGEQDAFEASYVEQAIAVPTGETLTSTTHIFAGAKELDVLEQVQNEVGIERFDMAINWGWLWFLTRPFVWLLTMLEGALGQFGLAILALTLMVKIVMFPLANRAYASMAKMKAVQPKMAALKERYAADQQKQQQALMELYKTEKINPLAGCLPILPQIPIFFALYQTLFNAIEMRHAPFFGWIRDLSAADPTNIWNLFGLIPYDPTGIWLIGGVLGIGAWPIIMGLTMAAQQALNPPPPDPMQARIFAFLPIVFTFILAPFAAGLVIYWAWNNFLSVLQQYIIMRRHGNETQVDKLVARLLKRGGGDES